MPLGSLNLYTRYVNAVLPTKQEAAKMQEAVLAQLEAVMPGTKTQTLAVTGGSMRSVRKLLVSLRWLDENSVQVKTSVLTDLIDYLLADTNRSAKHMLKIKPDRIHTFFCGLVITESAAKYIKADTIQILHSGVREGFLLSEMKGDTLER
jgi:exopolyphosphatase/guanosine-5'-triphosphate,3'-diphosphate pyrophosphatase